MTIQKLRDLIAVPTQLIDGRIYTTLSKDDDFRYDVRICFIVSQSGDRIRISGFSALKVPSDRIADALLFCNKYNQEKSFLQTYYSEGDQDFNADYSMPCEGVSDDTLKKYCRLISGHMWQFFVAVGKDF